MAAGILGKAGVCRAFGPIETAEEGFDRRILLDLQAPPSGQHFVELVDFHSRRKGEPGLGHAVALERLLNLVRVHGCSLRIAQTSV